MAQRLKHLPGMQETGVRFLGQEDPLEKEMATHSSILAWRIPWTEEPGGLQSTDSRRVGHYWATSLFFPPFIFISWRLITLQYCSGFCHTLTWISHGFTCVPHPDPPSRLLPHPSPLGLPSAPALSTCLATSLSIIANNSKCLLYS